MDAFLLSFGVIFLAELGDKSQFMALAFAARYRPWLVLVAVTIATLIVHAGSVVLGRAFALALPTNLINILAGVAFLVFAVWTLRGDEVDESKADRGARWAGSPRCCPSARRSSWPSWATRRCSRRSLWPQPRSRSGRGWARRPAWLSADALAIGIGALLGSRLPERADQALRGGRIRRVRADPDRRRPRDRQRTVGLAGRQPLRPRASTASAPTISPHRVARNVSYRSITGQAWLGTTATTSPSLRHLSHRRGSGPDRDSRRRAR